VTLIITAVAACVATALRFIKPEFGVRMHFGTLALIYWGASLMWVVDGITELMAGEPFVDLADPQIMSSDALLGVCVIILGIIVWAIVLLVSRFSSKSTGKIA
jgi:hypothetical protein